MLPYWFIYIAAILNSSSVVVYAYATLKGQTQPNRVTWLMWGIAPLVAFFAQLDQHAGLTALVTLTSGLGPLIVFICSFTNKAAYWRISSFDKICGLLSLAAVVFWLLAHNAMIALIFSIVADFTAAIPTLQKAYRAPETENGPTYVISSMAMLIGLLSVQRHGFVTSGFMAYLFCLITSLALLVYRHKITSRLKRSLL